MTSPSAAAHLTMRNHGFVRETRATALMRPSLTHTILIKDMKKVLVLVGQFRLRVGRFYELWHERSIIIIS
eukprot:scaffold614579_cov53-Prasinocladus_malaysianus.AAC.1